MQQKAHKKIKYDVILSLISLTKIVSFRIYDVNGDGFISKEELMQIFESSKIDDDVDHETTVTELLASADSDGDNQISYDEFKVLIQKHPSMIQDVTEEKKTRRTRHRGMSNLLHLPALGSNIKIVLLGTGESGKTTLFRQLEFLETGSYDEEHGVKYERLVKSNILHACITLVRAADDLGFPIKNQEIVDFANQRPHDMVFDAEMAEKVKQIWNDPDVQLIREHADEIMLQETVPYYINKIDKIASEEYDPSHEDVFRIKLKTTGVAEKVFKINGRQLVICDTGGQKVERKSKSPC
jgi:GTPase SAR1 family protein